VQARERAGDVQPEAVPAAALAGHAVEAIEDVRLLPRGTTSRRQEDRGASTPWNRTSG